VLVTRRQKAAGILEVLTDKNGSQLMNVIREVDKCAQALVYKVGNLRYLL
jgi:hypothetical protein